MSTLSLKLTVRQNNSVYTYLDCFQPSFPPLYSLKRTQIFQIIYYLLWVMYTLEILKGRTTIFEQYSQIKCNQYYPFCFPLEGFPELSTSQRPGLHQNMTTASQKMTTTHVLTYLKWLQKKFWCIYSEKRSLGILSVFSPFLAQIQPKMDPNV